MQSAEVRSRGDSTAVLNFTGDWRVFVQRQVPAGLVVICHVRQQYVPEVTLTKHNDVIEYLPPD